MSEDLLVLSENGTLEETLLVCIGVHQKSRLLKKKMKVSMEWRREAGF